MKQENAQNSESFHYSRVLVIVLSPSLHLKKISDLWSVRAGLHYRAVGMDAPGEDKAILWFWVGSHAEYNNFINGR